MAYKSDNDADDRPGGKRDYDADDRKSSKAKKGFARMAKKAKGKK